MYEIKGGQAREIAYDPAMFDYGKSGLQSAHLPQDLGFAGFQLFITPIASATSSPSSAQAISAQSEEKCSMASRRAAWPSTAACRAARSSRVSPPSGLNGPSPNRTCLRFMP
ncbi:glucan biosynthesis protein [Thiobacillus sp.]|uniref:glucan biosynthesis protein n=1 Tax=Thiobacillus sp. TaxID=924 RepID=UPI0025CD10CA|nr:glucan biosynthesis protein [Thiobacillus sp.]